MALASVRNGKRYYKFLQDKKQKEVLATDLEAFTFTFSFQGLTFLRLTVKMFQFLHQTVKCLARFEALTGNTNKTLLFASYLILLAAGVQSLGSYRGVCVSDH